MKRGVFLAFAIVALAAIASAAWAQTTVVVKPSDLGDWVQGGQGEATGAYQKFFDPAPPKPSTIDPNGTNNGAWFGYTGVADGTNPAQGTLWIGTNLYNGARLDQITMLKYRTWTDDAGIWATRAGPFRQLNPPREPARLQILIDRNDGSGLQSWILHMPWYGKNQGLQGSGTEIQGFATRQWQEYDGTTGYWLEIQNDVPNASTFVEHYDPGLLSVLVNYPNATIAAAPPATGLEWPLFLAPTGCALNFNCGAQRNSGNVNGLAMAGAWGNWWRDSYGMRYWLDDFTIGIDEGQGPVTTYYNFEADAPAPTVAIGGTDARSSRAACGVSEPTTNGTGCFRANCMGSDDFTFVVYGQILADPTPELNRFYMTDGGQRMEVVIPKPDMNFFLAGQWVRCKGFMQIDYGGVYNGAGCISDTVDFPGGDPDPLSDCGGTPVPPDMHPRLLCTNSNIEVLIDL